MGSEIQSINWTAILEKTIKGARGSNDNPGYGCPQYNKYFPFYLTTYLGKVSLASVQPRGALSAGSFDNRHLIFSTKFLGGRHTKTKLWLGHSAPPLTKSNVHQ